MINLPANIKKKAQFLLMTMLCASAPGCATTKPNTQEPAQTQTPANYPTLPDAWFAVWSPLGEPPLIEFTFPAPQDMYVGEIHRASGHLRFGKARTFDRARGRFEIFTHAVEMGEHDLTQNVQNAIDMLYAKRFPKIYYEIRSITSNAEKIEFNKQTPITLHGLFKLKGVTFTQDVQATVNITQNQSDHPVMRLTGSFTITDIKSRFDISGPGDPEQEAANNVRLKFDFPLVPEDVAKAIKAKELSERRPFNQAD